MLVNKPNLQSLFTGFNTKFNAAFEAAPSQFRLVSMEAPSAAREETYAWLGQFARMREWIGQRNIRNLSLHSYTLKNKTFEDTVSIPRTDIEDDKFGIFNPVVSEMGRSAAMHPDELIFALLSSGFDALCYDGQPFFDADHPRIQADGTEVSVSNMQAGAETPWFLLDCSREIKPTIWQPRMPYEFQMQTDLGETNVFMNDEFRYGVRARANAGFGFWQMAFGSKATLDAANYEAARSAIASLKGDNDRPLALSGTHLVVPPSLEGAARKLVVNTVNTAGASNEWAGSAELIVSPWLA